MEGNLAQDSRSAWSGDSACGTLIKSSIIKHLPFFIAVAEEGSIQKAANRLNVVQPALSRRIQEFERSLGIQLFDRLPRGIQLSEAGKIFLEDGRIAIERFERAWRRALMVGHGKVGTLRIGLTDTALSHKAVMSAISHFRQKFPDVIVHIAAGVSQDQLDLLRDEETEIALLFLNPGDAHGFNTQMLASENFNIVMPKEHRLSGKTMLHPTDLVGEPLIMPARNRAKTFYKRLWDAFEQFSISPQIATEALNVDQTMSMVEAGIGLGIVNTSKMPLSPQLTAVAIEHLPQMDFSIVWPKNRSMARADYFRELICEQFSAIH